MSAMKAEFLYHYHRSRGVPFRTQFFGRIADINALAARLPRLSNFLLAHPLTGGLVKRALGVAPQRSLPALHTKTLRRWFERTGNKLNPTREQAITTVYLFCDEFTNYNDAHIGIKTVQLLTSLGYRVEIPAHPESGRAAISKGLLQHARALAIRQVQIFAPLATEQTPLVGIEPSAILSFRDEYPRLVPEADRDAAKALGKNALLIEEFLAREMQAGRIHKDRFTKEKRRVLLHGHCHQKALATVDVSAWVAGFPENFEVELIPSGCCGMAGSFGYEKEHYDISMKIGELVLFPAVRNAPANTILAAPGTSCRCQIADGTGRKAKHPVEILYENMR
jgi:Fe-S oxidoreductase